MTTKYTDAPRTRVMTPASLNNGAGSYTHLWADVQPQLVHDMCRAYLDGDVARARDIQIAGQPLINALFSEVNPIPVKEALAQICLLYTSSMSTSACFCLSNGQRGNYLENTNRCTV